jgi:hypothetical protein
MSAVYLDTSVYNRPFDDQTQPRIWLETLAFAVVLQMIEAEEIDLVKSSVLDYENDRNPFPLRKQWVQRCLGLAASSQGTDQGIRERAQELEDDGLQAIDALHVACAEKGGAEWFLTCDDRLIRRYSGSMQAINPVDFVLSVAGESR